MRLESLSLLAWTANMFATYESPTNRDAHTYQGPSRRAKFNADLMNSVKGRDAIHALLRWLNVYYGFLHALLS